jgi:serine acetyltransferase
MQKIKVGDNCTIGIGSVVLKDVPSGAVMAGNPAKILKMKE